MTDHYETLGLGPDATEDEIKQAARRMAKNHHPDRPGGDVAKMQAVNRAKLVLLDPELRARYDETGDDTGTTQLVQAATQMLADFFSQYIEHGKDEDPLVVIRLTLRGGTEKQRSVIADSQTKIASFEKRIDRVKKPRGTKMNLFEGVLKARITQVQMAIASAERAIAINEHCALLVDEYEFNPPAAPQQPTQAQYMSLDRGNFFATAQKTNQ